MKRAGIWIAAGFVVAVASVLAAPRQQEAFPHRTHARLFPLCESCHLGIVSGDSLQRFPPAASCARCHDGNSRQVVAWQGPRVRGSNLAFTHTAHANATTAAGRTLECASCHAEQQPAQWMAVARARPETCLSCHAQGAGAPAHLAQDTECTKCHVPVTDAKRLTVAQIQAFPRPASHQSPTFVSTHAPADARAVASCSVCHTAQTCARCHANAERLPNIAALGTDQRLDQIQPGKPAVYPKPASHAQPSWIRAHGAIAQQDVATCANCHTAPSCDGCHAAGGARAVIARLPAPSGTATGVVPGPGTSGPHPARWAELHAVEAGGDGASCSSCHAEKFCSDCHRGSDSRRFHPANFAARHGPDSYAASTECASCHSREVFCQACHTGLGMSAAASQRTGAFHDRQPSWLLQHSQAARQNLESCTTCHTQNSCLRCHSSKGGWGVSPHGPGFNARREYGKNPVTCGRCHSGRPPGT